jgi:hypothetical protein
MQVVLTSTDPSELCINGMSFSRRASKWANSALVVTVSAHDFKPFESYGPLAGVEFQVLVVGILCDDNRTTQISSLCKLQIHCTFSKQHVRLVTEGCMVVSMSQEMILETDSL